MSSDQHMKKLMSLREGLHVMMQCYIRQHFANRFWLHEHPGGPASWGEPTMRKFTKESTTYFVKGLVCRWNVQKKMRSESSEYVRKTTGFLTNSRRIKTALESYFEEHAQEVWKRETGGMQTTLLNTYLPKLIATILKALREQLKESDQPHSVEEIAGPAPEIPLEYDQILKGGGRFWDDVNGGYLTEDLVLAARREEIDWVRSEGVYEIEPMQECRDAGMKPLDLIWVDTDKSVDPTRKEIRSRLCAREYKTKNQGKIQRAPPASQLIVLCNATSGSGECACLNHDVGEFVEEERETIEVETLRHQQSTFPRNSPETYLHQTSRRESSEVWRRRSWQIGQEHFRNSRRFLYLAT